MREEAHPDFRLIASDIDGTLAGGHGAPIPPRTVGVLRRLLARGLPVVLVTGLNPWSARRYVEAIGPEARAIALNGIFLLEGDEIREGHFLDEALVREGARLALEAGYTPLIYGADGITRYLPGGHLEAVERLIAERPYQPYRAVESFEALFAVRPAQVSVCGEEAEVAPLVPLWEQALGNRAYVIFQPGKRTWLEANHPRARKDVALLELAARLGIPREAILYFGDNLNDLVLFRAIPHAVAVGNARPEVKALAWRTAPPQAEEGVAAFLEAIFG